MGEGSVKHLERRLRQAYVNVIWLEGELVFADFHTLCVFTVGEAFMPPEYGVRFRLTFRIIDTFHRREA